MSEQGGTWELTEFVGHAVSLVESVNYRFYQVVFKKTETLMYLVSEAVKACTT